MKLYLNTKFFLCLPLVVSSGAIELSAKTTIPTPHTTIGQAPIKRYTISGYVRDMGSSETLIGASITDTRSGATAMTNAYGFFSLTLPEGEVRLRIGQVGYEAQYHNLVLSENTTLHFTLVNSTTLAEAIVTAKHSETGIGSTKLGAIELTAEQLRAAPALLGEPDVMKTIQLLPGVQPSIDGTAGINVRGGSPDQNLILLDGIPLYNVDHAMGLFSVFSPEAVKKMSFYKASYPARYGGRLSSVVDVRTNDGDMNSYHGLLSIGLLSSRLHAEGPIVKDRMSFHVAARRTYLDAISRPLMPKDEQVYYYFYDVNAKLNYRFSDRSRLYLMLYGGNDRLSSNYTDDYNNMYSKNGGHLNWGNRVAALRWNYVLSERLFTNTTLAFNRYKMDINNFSEERTAQEQQRFDSRYASEIRDWSFTTDLHYYPSPKHTIRAGVGYTYHTFIPQVMTLRTREQEAGSTPVDSVQRSIFNRNIYAHEASLYAEDDWHISPQWQLNIGAHASLFDVRGKTYMALQPRASLRYAPTPDWAVKVGYTEMQQHVHLLTSMSIAMPTDLWVPVTDKVRPMHARQYSVGGYYTGSEGWEFSAEVYYKDMRHLLEYRDGASYFGVTSNWESKIESGRGHAYGVEVMLQRTVGRTTGWLNYAWSKAERKFDNGRVNRGEWFPYKHDRRHSINLMLNHKFSPRFEIGGSWVFYTGGAMTLATAHTELAEPDRWDYRTEAGLITSRNNFRLPPTHRLSLSFSWHKKLKKRGLRTWNVSLFNVYNAMNPTFVYGTHSGSPSTYVVKKITALPLIPSVTYTYRF